MEIYADCDICGKWDDLARWKTGQGITLGCVCIDCYNKLDAYTIENHNRTKTRAFEKIRKEAQHGKR